MKGPLNPLLSLTGRILACVVVKLFVFFLGGGFGLGAVETLKDCGVRQMESEPHAESSRGNRYHPSVHVLLILINVIEYKLSPGLPPQQPLFPENTAVFGLSIFGKKTQRGVVGGIRGAWFLSKVRPSSDSWPKSGVHQKE